jgi:hypothetical protein
VSWTDSLNATNWEHYKDPRNVVPVVLLTAAILGSVRIWRSYLRRIPTPGHVQPAFYRKRSLFGQVTSVGDGDNFHLFHTPGGRLAGWGWLRDVPAKRSDLKNKTVRSTLANRKRDWADELPRRYPSELLVWTPPRVHTSVVLHSPSLRMHCLGSRAIY